MNTKEEEKLCDLYEVEECVKWIQQNNYLRTCLQFSKQCLQNSSRISLILQKRTQTQFFISYSTMCCVDYLSVQHLNESTADSIIYFGDVCLTSSQFSDSLPVLHVFTKTLNTDSLQFIESAIVEMQPKNCLILYNTINAFTALETMKIVEQNATLKDSVFIAKLNIMCDKWKFTETFSPVLHFGNNDTFINFCQFSLQNELKTYDLVVYLGECNSLDLTVNCDKLLEIDINSRTKRLISGPKELRKRVALIEKFKQKSCRLVGVLFTNPLPNVSEMCAQSKQLSRKNHKKVYFISLVQAFDEYKLGNFGQLNAFVVSNSCFCSSALKAIDYCLPVLNWTEFLIASGVKTHYGGVVWNETIDSSETQNSDSDTEESDVKDLNNKLIETKVFETNHWFGLEVNAGDREASVVKMGQTGVASAYDNENIL